MVFRHVDELIVSVWGSEVGVLYRNPQREGQCLFEYSPSWVRDGVNLSPLGLRFNPADPQGPPAHGNDDDRAAWHGVPALLADSVPDDFGNRVIDAALAREGVSLADISALDRLAYVGERGMGALVFEPSRTHNFTPTAINLSDLVSEARELLRGNLDGDSRNAALTDIILTGTSAGGARAKAVIAWNRETSEVRAGNLPLPAGAVGFEQWLIKFDGINKGDYGLSDPTGQTRAEHVYALMAKQADIQMSETLLLDEGPRSHFMTRRFDRPGVDGERLHVQTLNALAGMNFKYERSYSYEQVFTAMRDVGVFTPDDLEQMFRRAVFNVLASNNDDHTKNWAFLMDPAGRWRLAPAYDLSFAYKPDHRYIGQHFLSINGKFDGHGLTDLHALGNAVGWQVPDIKGNIERVADAVSRFSTLAREWEVPTALASKISTRIDAICREVGLTGVTLPTGPSGASRGATTTKSGGYCGKRTADGTPCRNHKDACPHH